MQAEAGAVWGKGHEPWGVVHLKAGSFFRMAGKASGRISILQTPEAGRPGLWPQSCKVLAVCCSWSAQGRVIVAKACHLPGRSWVLPAP